MQDRFYVGGDIGKREVKTPQPYKMHESSFTPFSYKDIKETNTDVVRVYNPKIENIPVKF